jgi:hypothetical protein
VFKVFKISGAAALPSVSGDRRTGNGAVRERSES